MKRKIVWLVLLAIALISITYFGWTYAKLRSVEDHLPLVLISVARDQNFLSSKLANYELKRRIAKGDFIGEEVLLDTLTVGLHSEDLVDSAIQRAEWLVTSVVDVNARSIANGDTALHMAVAINDTLVVEQLIRLGADPSVRSGFGRPDDSGFTALDQARFTREVFPEWDMTDIFAILEGAPQIK